MGWWQKRISGLEIMQNNAITPFKVTDFGTNRKLIYDFLLVTNTNLPPILNRFRDIAIDRSEMVILGYPSCLIPLAEGFPRGQCDGICEFTFANESVHSTMFITCSDGYGF